MKQEKSISLLPGCELPPLEGFFPYLAIVIAQRKVDAQWQGRVSRWLVDTGCRWMMAWGEDCSSWDDSVDLVCLEKYDFGDVPEENEVMSTWHDGQSLEEVFLFAKTNAFYMGALLENSLLLHIGWEDRRHEFHQAYQRA